MNAPTPTGHTCDADCWAYMLRYGLDENTTGCNASDARAAADAQTEALR